MILLEKEKSIPQATYVALASALKTHGYHVVVSDNRLKVENCCFVITDCVNCIVFSEDIIFLPASESQDTLKGMILMSVSPNFSPDSKIVNFVREIGIRTNLKGYHFLITAITLAVQNPKLLENITSALYPAVAKIYNVDPRCVERNIRNAINYAYQNDPARICKFFHNGLSKPYPSEIISFAADSILKHIPL